MPKFTEGQEVILTSALFPQLNGPQRISGVHPPIEGQVLERTGTPDVQAAYTLHGVEGYWAEHSLKAKA